MIKSRLTYVYRLDTEYLSTFEKYIEKYFLNYRTIVFFLSRKLYLFIEPLRGLSE